MDKYIKYSDIPFCKIELEERCHNDRWTEIHEVAYKTEIDRIPAADVVPVVRCKDCTHSRKGKESLECEKHRYAWNDRLRWVDDNDFCCWGVRKDGDGK